MKRKSLIAASCIISMLILGIVVTYVMPTFIRAMSTEIMIRAVSDVSELGDPVTMPDVRNSTFSVAVVVEDTNLTSDLGLFGLDVQFNWTTEWITYTGYTVTVPVEDYSTVQPPSPYAGILHEPTMKLHEAIDESASIPLAESGTMAWIAYAIMPGAALFNGSGTICVFTFNVTDQPFNYEGSKTIKIHFLKTDLSDSVPGPIEHTVQDLEITLHPRKFEIEYPQSPMLEVTPDFVTGYGINETFSLDVLLVGADGADLDAFWDVAGCDFYLNFNATLIEAIDIIIDPDWQADPSEGFGSFWSEGTFELAEEIDNTEGWVHVAFMGIGETHDPVNGTTRIATIDFNVIYESELLPEGPMDLENPLLHQIWYILDAEGGIVDLSMPVTTEWLTVFPVSLHGLGFNLTDWEDVDGDSALSVGDQVILLNKDTLKTYDYYVDSMTGTLQLTQYPFPFEDDYVWPTDSWTADGMDYCGLSGRTTASFYGVFDGEGHADWTGNFTLDYPFTSVNSITANFVANGSSRVLTQGVDYIVHADEDLVELLSPVDVDIINECWVDGGNNTLNGWPAIGYTATSIQGVYVKMPNGTERYSPGGFGCFETAPPCEWWYEPDYPCELEGWWALGYYQGNWTWPTNSTWYINYTAASYLTIDYNAEPDARPYYVGFEGDYADFLVLGDPANTSWHEVYPKYCTTWNLIAFDDVDSSGSISVDDMITLNSTDGLVRDYEVDALSTDIKVVLKPCIQDIVPGDYYYTDPVIVEIAGFPHPERLYSPWFGRSQVVRLPNAVENGTFKAIPEFNGLLVMLPFLLAAIAIVVTRKLPKKK